MIRNFAARATFPIVLSLTGFVAVCCILLYTFMKRDLVNHTLLLQSTLGDTVISTTRYSMLRPDREALSRTIRYMGQQEGVEFVRIFNKSGRIMFSSLAAERGTMVDTNAEGCVSCHAGPRPVTYLGPMEKARHIRNAAGKPVIAVTTPIYNDVECGGAGCHLPPEQAKILGILDMGVSGQALAESLWTLRMRMTVFCLMVLVVTMGASCALLRRNVLQPLQELVTYTEAVKRGNTEAEEPHGTPEIETIGKAIHDIAVHEEKGKGGKEGGQDR